MVTRFFARSTELAHCETGKGDGLMTTGAQGTLSDRCASIGPIEITGAELFRVSDPSTGAVPNQFR